MNVLGITDERRKVSAAIVGSIFVHIFVVGIITLGSGLPFSFLATPVPQKSEPVRIRIIEEPSMLRPLPVKKAPEPRPQFGDSPTVARGTPPPDTKTQSDADSVAASEKAGDGPKSSPNLEGRNKLSVELQNQRLQFTPGSSAPPRPPPQAPPQMAKLATPKPPTPRPAQPPKEQTQKPQRPTDWTESARSAPAPVPTPLPSNPRREIAFSELPKPDRSVPKPDAPPLVTEIPKSLVTLEPVKPVQPSQAQVRPPAPTTGPLAIESVMSRAGGVQEQKIQSQVRGGAARRGPAAFDSVGTPIGRYRKMMAQSINARWQAYVAHQMDLVTLGSVKVRFDLLPDGTVEDVTLVSNDANSTLATLSIQAIMEAKIPPIPPDLVGALKDGRLEIEYTFNVW